MSNLQTCLAKCVRYGVGTPAYALASSKCYAQYQEGRVPADPDKVTFWTSEMWTKAANDLYTFLMVRGGLSPHCADAARDALNSTGWERKAKVSDVADTVYFHVERKVLCGKASANEAQNWVNRELNQILRRYRTEEQIPLPEVVTPPTYVGEIPGDDPSEGVIGRAIKKIKDKPEGYCGIFDWCSTGYKCVDNHCELDIVGTTKKYILIIAVIGILLLLFLVVLRSHGFQLGG